jgi:hypothetical protein
MKSSFLSRALAMLAISERRRSHSILASTIYRFIKESFSVWSWMILGGSAAWLPVVFKLDFLKGEFLPVSFALSKAISALTLDYDLALWLSLFKMLARLPTIARRSIPSWFSDYIDPSI